jgi:SPP1 gp7 family putative phage head morphogenesis protein
MLLILATTKVNLEKELRSFYQKYGKDGVVTWQEARKWISGKDHRRRLTTLLLYLTGEFDSALSELTPKFRNFLTEVAKKEMEFFNVDIDLEDVLSTVWGVDELTWLKRLEDDLELWTMYVGNDIKRSIMRRDDIEKVLKQLDKRFMSMENIIQKLAMTESTAVGSIARREIFKELGIKKYRYYAREDERTCEVCGSLHGLEFPISSYEVGVNASPIHPWCRCWEVPIMD